jgi:spore coat protein A
MYYSNNHSLTPRGPLKGCDEKRELHNDHLRRVQGDAEDRSHAKTPGKAYNTYSNDQPSSTLWYHDHAMGITRLNVYAASAGFWIIRENEGGETGFDEESGQKLPGPPAMLGEDPNGNEGVRRKIREIPLAIQPKSFYEDGSLWYPSNRQFFDEMGEGVIYGSNCMLDIHFRPEEGADVPPIWNPEAFFNTIVVNGRTWPKFHVASERYRFRILNAADSRFLNLSLKAFTADGRKELPFYVIGSDQSLLPYVVKVSTGIATRLNGPASSFIPLPPQALLMGPSERYDVIVDFSELESGDEVVMENTGPDEPFAGWEWDGDHYDPDPANRHTTRKVMKFIVDELLNNPDGDPSTDPEELILDSTNPGGARVLEEPDFIRSLTLNEVESTTEIIDDKEETFDGPVAALLGTPEPKRWDDLIDVNPAHGSTETWEIKNTSEDAHPVHLHLVKFQVLDRIQNYGSGTEYHIDGVLQESGDEEDSDTPGDVAAAARAANDSLASAVNPIEEGWKDTVIAYPGQTTVVKAKFDMKGLYVWHCHILAHEDNEMMLPYCVGECGVDCPPHLCA